MAITKHQLEQQKTIVYKNKLVTYVDWASRDMKKGTIMIKILGRKTYQTVDYADLKNAVPTKLKK